MLTYAHVFSRMLTVLRMQARDASLEETAEAAAGAAKERAELLQSLEVPYIEYASIRPHTSAYVSIRAEFGGAPIELVLPKDYKIQIRRSNLLQNSRWATLSADVC